MVPNMAGVGSSKDVASQLVRVENIAGFLIAVSSSRFGAAAIHGRPRTRRTTNGVVMAWPVSRALEGREGNEVTRVREKSREEAATTVV